MTQDEARKLLEEREGALTYTPKENESEMTREEKKKRTFEEIDEAKKGKGIIPRWLYHGLNQAVNAPEEIVHGMIQPILEQDPNSLMGQMSQESGAKRKAEFEEAFNEAPGAALGGNFIGNAGMLAPINGLLGSVAKLPFLARAPINAAASAGLNYLNYVNPGESRDWNALVGGVLGATIPEAISGIGAAGGKLYNAAKGYVEPMAEKVMQLGKKFNVPVFAGDVSVPGGAVQKTTELMEKPPFINVTPERLAQQKAAQEAAQTLLEESEKNMIQESFGGANGMAKLQKIASGTGKRADAAKKLIEEMTAAGTDWNHIIKASGNAKLLSHKIEADRLYDQVGNLAFKMGKVDIKSTVSNLDKNIAELAEFPETNKKALAALKAMRRDLFGKTKATEASKVVDINGKPIVEAVESVEVPKDLTFEQLRKLRTTVSEKINDFYTGKDTLIGQRGAGYLQELKNNIDRDLKHFATKNGDELANAWYAADKYYKKYVVPFKDAALARALKSESNADEIYGMFVKAGGGPGDKGTGRSVKFFNALDGKGKEAVRYGMIKDALDHATDELGHFSPAKFATKLEKLAAAREVFFKGTHYEIDGLTKLMRAVQRSGQMKSPDTGVKNLPLLIAGTLGGVGAAHQLTSDEHKGKVQKGAQIAGGLIGLKVLMTTPKGRNFLLAASRLDERSPKWAKLMSNIYSYIENRGTALGAAAGKTANKYSSTHPEAAEG